MVKQFSNGAMDNIYNFIFKWVDFGKVLLEVFWAFLEIWQAFTLIFYNIAMYFYYLFLFFIDRGTEETQATRIFRRPISKRLSSTPSVRLSSEIAIPFRLPMEKRPQRLPKQQTRWQQDWRQYPLHRGTLSPAKPEESAIRSKAWPNSFQISVPGSEKFSWVRCTAW
jgi:hypothetical protein